MRAQSIKECEYKIAVNISKAQVCVSNLLWTYIIRVGLVYHTVVNVEVNICSVSIELGIFRVRLRKKVHAVCV